MVPAFVSKPEENQPVTRVFVIALALSLATPAFAVDSTGVKQCDHLLTRYEACSAELPKDKLHEAQTELLKGAMSIRAAATQPNLKEELERYCTERFEQMKREGTIKDCMAK
jgi:hypothetical protein